MLPRIDLYSFIERIQEIEGNLHVYLLVDN